MFGAIQLRSYLGLDFSLCIVLLIMNSISLLVIGLFRLSSWGYFGSLYLSNYFFISSKSSNLLAYSLIFTCNPFDFCMVSKYVPSLILDLSLLSFLLINQLKLILLRFHRTKFWFNFVCIFPIFYFTDFCSSLQYFLPSGLVCFRFNLIFLFWWGYILRSFLI